MQEVLGILANVLRTYAIYRFMELFTSSKDISWRAKLAVYSTFILLTSGSHYIVHNHIITYLMSFLGLTLVTFIYEEDLKKKMIFAIGIFTINVVVESLAFSIIGLYEEYDELTRFIRKCAISLGIYFCVFLLEHTNLKSEGRLGIKTSVWLMMLCVPVFSIIEVFYIWQTGYGRKYYMSIEIAGILFINIAVFYLYGGLQDYYKQKIEKEELRIVTESYRNQMDIMKESWEKVRGLRHDLRLHVHELRYLAIHQDTDRLLEYLNGMERQMTNEGESVSSGIQDIDSTLNYFLLYARRNLDDVKIKVALPEELEVSGFSLNVILENLLNNAIRAAQQSECKYLNVSLNEKQGVLYIKIENSYSGKLHIRENKLVSTKSGLEMHGIGLKTVERIVKDQGGDMEISWNEGIFCVKVMLFMDHLQGKKQ